MIDIFSILTYIEDKILQLSNSGLPDQEVGNFLNYEIVNDETLQLNYGFSGYEEHENNELIIRFYPNIIILNKKVNGFSVMSEDGSDYNDIVVFELKSNEELINYLNE